MCGRVVVKMRYSYTFLDTYMRCHKRAYLQYVKKVIDYNDYDNRPFIVGIVVDKLFEKWVQRDFELGYMEGNAEGLFNWYCQRRKVIWKGEGDKERLQNRAVKVARLLQDVALDAGLPDMGEIDVQKKVLYKGEPGFEEFEFYGKLDIWIPKFNAVWDLKVTTQKKYLKRYQLDFFTWLLERTGHEVKEIAFLVPEMRPAVQYFDIEEADKVSFEQELLMLLSDIRNEEEWLPTAKECWGCPVWSHCDQDETANLKVEKKGVGFKIYMGDD